MSGTEILGLYYDDVEIDTELTTQTHVISYDDIVAFADITLDHHPLHTDEVHVKVTFTKKRDSSKPGRGVVTEKVQLVNQTGEVVTVAEHTTLLIKRPV